MITFLTIRELNINKHQNVEYVILFIYMIDKDDVDNDVRTCFRRETHVVDDLKINMLIENNVIDVENFTINFQRKIVYVKECKITIFIEIKFLKTFVVHRSIHLKKTIIVFSHVELAIFIYLLSNNFSHFRNFLFESKNVHHLLMYAYLIDVFIEIVIIRNDNDRSIQISRNIRLSKIFELKYSNVFLISFENDDENIQKLAIQQSIFAHRKKWFRKIINVCVVVFVVIVAIETIVFTFTNNESIVTTISWKFFAKIFYDFRIASNSLINWKSFIVFCDFKSIEIRLFNEVIIYDFDKKIVDTFQQIVKNFSTLWIDTNFVEMLEINWMKISLKNDWESRISSKTKIYSLSIRDRRLINEIFDDFHDFDKLSWTTNSTLFNYLVFCV